MTSMKQWIIKETKGPDALQFVDAEKPKVANAHEVLIKVHALSLNARDGLFTKGQYPAAVPPAEGRVVVSDGAGEVVAIGDAVSAFKVGDRVTSIVHTGHHFTIDPRPENVSRSMGFRVDGIAREFYISEEAELLHIPKHMTYEEAASLGTAATTAWTSLYAHSPKLRPGQTVLCMGTGGVSLFAAQIALAGGARIIVTSSSDDKLKAAREHLDKLVRPGADESVIQTINYRTHPDWEKEVEKKAPGGKCDFVIEIGGMLTLGKSVASTKQGGLVAVSGFLSSLKELGDNDKVLKDDIAMRILGGGVNVRGTFVSNREDYREMVSAMELAGIKPIIDKVFSFEQLKEAYEYSLAGSHFGKIVVKLQ